MSSLLFVSGNDYKEIPDSRAVFDRSGNFPKVHDVTVYVDIVQGNPNLVEKVMFDLGSTFEPREFPCNSPIPVRKPNGTQAWRFYTRQRVYGGFAASIRIRGCSGTTMGITHHVECSARANTNKGAPLTFTERRGLQPLRNVKLPNQQKFGVELELTSHAHMSPEQLASQVPFPIAVVDTYHAGRRTFHQWKLVPDSSIMCSPNQPSCNKFELVSPVLQGGDGLSEVSRLLNALPTSVIQVNKSMGLHVHVDVSCLSMLQLIKVCQQFLKYEAAMDSIMPPSRRTGSAESIQYFQSNRSSVGGKSTGQMMDNLATCYDLVSLAQMMNREGRYYKLNLKNLETGRQPTIEFRQHSATFTYSKVSAWVRFCVAFVTNSAKLKAPQPFATGRSLEQQFDALFYYVIKDRALHEFYKERRQQLRASSGTYDMDHCCAECAVGGSCRG
jgi:hypothetical protein